MAFIQKLYAIVFLIYVGSTKAFILTMYAIINSNINLNLPHM